jgi:hypothetical protein
MKDSDTTEKQIATPPRIALRLTPYQARRLRRHFAWTKAMKAVGQHGFIVGQFHDKEEYAYGDDTKRGAIMRVGFLPPEKADAWEHSALPASTTK